MPINSLTERIERENLQPDARETRMHRREDCGSDELQMLQDTYQHLSWRDKGDGYTTTDCVGLVSAKGTWALNAAFHTQSIAAKQHDGPISLRMRAGDRRSLFEVASRRATAAQTISENTVEGYLRNRASSLSQTTRATISLALIGSFRQPGNKPDYTTERDRMARASGERYPRGLYERAGRALHTAANDLNDRSRETSIMLPPELEEALFGDIDSREYDLMPLRPDICATIIDKRLGLIVDETDGKSTQVTPVQFVQKMDFSDPHGLQCHEIATDAATYLSGKEQRIVSPVTKGGSSYPRFRIPLDRSDQTFGNSIVQTYDRPADEEKIQSIGDVYRDIESRATAFHIIPRQ